LFIVLLVRNEPLDLDETQIGQLEIGQAGHGGRLYTTGPRPRSYRLLPRWSGVQVRRWGKH
jgi:hypothetical protein